MKVNKLNINWDHLEILTSGKTDLYHCEIMVKRLLFIQEHKPTFNVNISSEKLMVY